MNLNKVLLYQPFFLKGGSDVRAGGEVERTSHSAYEKSGISKSQIIEHVKKQRVTHGGRLFFADTPSPIG